MSKLNIEDIIREKAGEFEITVPGNAWTDFETKVKTSGNEAALSQSVSGSIISATVTKIALIACLFVVPVIGIYFLMDIGKAERKKLFEQNNQTRQVTVEEEPAKEVIQNIGKGEKKKEINDDKEVAKKKIYVFNPINDGKIVYFGLAEANRENIIKFRIIIRDKKGKVVFESKNQKVLWDGKIAGKDRYAKDGLYNWFIIMEDSTNKVYRRWGKVRLEKE